MVHDASPTEPRGQGGQGFAKALFEGSTPSILLIDLASQTVRLTPESEALLGLKTVPATRTSLQDLPSELARIAQEASATGAPVSGPMIERVAAGAGKRLLGVSAMPLGPGAASSQVVLVIRDLSFIRRLEEQVVQLDRLASLGTLSAGMAHEVKNALVASKTFIDLLLERNQDAELAQIVRREMDRIDSLVGGMLRFAGRRSVSFSPVQIHETLEHSLRLIERQIADKSIALRKSLGAAPAVVQGDEYELQQAFVNLLLNAIEAMEPKGTLTIESRRQPGVAGVVEGESSDTLCVTIEDTGTGITEEVMARLFEPFVSTKPSGTGLGLAITQRIVQQHRGTITVQSRPGGGTRFTICLPTLPVTHDE